MKRWLYIGGAFLILALIVFYFLYSSLDSIVKAAVEKYGSEITQAAVRLNSVKIELASGKGALRGLTVANPAGFKTDRAFSLGEISVQLDAASVMKDTVIIKEISISAPEVTYEFGLKGSNIDALKRNVDAYVARGKEQSGKGASPKDEGRGGKKLVVEHLYVRNGKVNISAPELQGKTASAALPDIHLADIGKKSDGATAGELAEQVLGAMGRGAANAAVSSEIGKMIGSAKLGIIGEKAKERGGALQKFFGK